MEFRVLGSIEVVENGRRLPVASGRQLSLLALLIARANRVVPADRIIDSLWGDDPPETGAKAVAFHVSRLRDALEPGRRHGQPSRVLVTEPTGYVLRVEPDRIDAVAFERLVQEGHGLLAQDPDNARARLDEALSLWRGDPYADVADEAFARGEIERLKELHAQAREDRLDAELALGRHADAIGMLEVFVAEQPLRERVRGQLMIALYRAGRQTEALRTYADARQVLADELGIEPGPEIQRLQTWILQQDPRLDPPAAKRTARNPYKGLRPFEERDSADFFGREALVGRLLERLGQASRAAGFLGIVGPSGCGKSSVVRAGMIPALRAGSLPGSNAWRIAIMLPGAHPFRELAAALRTLGLDVPRDLEDPGSGQDRPGGALIRSTAGETTTLLVIDQLEELFTLVEDPAERSGFIAMLADALSDPGSKLLVTATLRADHLTDALVEPMLGDLLRTGTEIVTPLTRDELERAIELPANAVGVRLEAGLATEMLADLARQPGELPLLQYALTELFERSDGQRLTRDSYAAIGGIAGALGRRADEALAGLDADGRELARQVLLRLVAAGESGQPVARRVPRTELRALGDAPGHVDAVVDEFGRRRLLAFDRDVRSGEGTVQVAHEALLTRWPRLAGWIDEARGSLWTRRRLADAAAEWIAAGREPGFLLAGNRLELFASWADNTNLRLDLPERELLDASIAEQRRQVDAASARVTRERALERRATTRLRALVAVLAAALLAASALALTVYRHGETAREEGAVAVARELAAGSVGNLGTDPGLSLLLAWHAADATADRGYVVEEAMDALHWAIQESHVAYPVGDGPVAVLPGPGGPRGVELLAPDRLMALAASTAGRSLTAAECRTYLHRATCAPPTALDLRTVPGVYTATGVVPFTQLAGPSLAGSRVEVVSQLPVDLAPEMAGFSSRTGIGVTWTPTTESQLEARIASGDLPDLAIVERPADVADLARRGLLVDLSGIVDVAGLRTAGSDYLLGLGTVGRDGGWPASSGRLYGATVATEVESLVWYPTAAFQRAGYRIPQTWADLDRLAATMLADGRSPWCLGLAAGQRTGTAAGLSATSFVEDLVLHASGPAVYDAWSTGAIPFTDEAVSRAVVTFGELALGDGYVGRGLSSALVTPADLAAWPMFVDPPGCWLDLAGGATRATWPAGGSETLSAFPFPAIDPRFPDVLRGRAYMAVVFRDRPEVRRLLDELLDAGFGATAGPRLASDGIWPTAQAGTAVPVGAVARAEREELHQALAANTFRVSILDLVPRAVGDAFASEMSKYLFWGQISPSAALGAIQSSWPAAR